MNESTGGLTTAARKKLIAAVPWIAYSARRTIGQCESVRGKASQAAFRGEPGAYERHRCKNLGSWIFIDVEGQVWVTCWWHVLAFVVANPEEEFRFEQWAKTDLPADLLELLAA
jgi:hypothetical protein